MPVPPLAVSVVLPVKLRPGVAADVRVNCHAPFMLCVVELPHPNIKTSAITSPRPCAYLILSPSYLLVYRSSLPDDARARCPTGAWSVPIRIPDSTDWLAITNCHSERSRGTLCSPR